MGKTDGDAWLTNKANPVSLLNLTEQLEHFGPLRWYWEGVCERYIQIVKPYLIKNMRRTPSYFKKKLSMLHKMVLSRDCRRYLTLGSRENLTNHPIAKAITDTRLSKIS